MQLFLVAHGGALAHKYIINAAFAKSCFPFCCEKSYGIHRCASDHPLNVFSFHLFPHAAFVSVQCNKQPAEPPALTQRGAGCHKQLPKGRDHKVSLARHAGGLRHALPTSQKIQILNEGSAGLPPAPAPLGDVDGVSQG